MENLDKINNEFLIKIFMIISLGVLIIISLVLFSNLSDSTKSFGSDSSSQSILGNNASLTTLSPEGEGITNLTSATAKNRTRVQFPDRVNYIRVGESGNSVQPLISDGSNFTISAWVNISDLNQRGGIYGYQSPAYGPYSYEFSYINNVNGLGMTIYNGTTAQSSYLGQPTANNWQHLVYTFNGTTMVAYWNGALNKSTAVTLGGTYPKNGTASTARATTIGPTYTGGSYNLRGQIDELRVYTRALSASEITEIYNSGRIANSSLTDTNLLSWYSFDENTGTTAYDKINGYNGTLINGTTYSNDGIDVTLTENTDYTFSGTSFKIINDYYSWKLINASWVYTTVDIDPSSEMITSFATYPVLIGLIGTIILLGAVIAYLFVSVKGRA